MELKRFKVILLAILIMLFPVKAFASQMEDLSIMDNEEVIKVMEQRIDFEIKVPDNHSNLVRHYFD